MKRLLLLFILLLVAPLHAVTALSNGDPVKADGEYSYPVLRAGSKVLVSLSGSFGGGTATVGYINPAGAFTALQNGAGSDYAFTSAGTATVILPENAAGDGKPAVSLTGSTLPSITVTITKVADSASTVDEAELSIGGGQNKVLKTDGSGNLVLGPYDNRTSGSYLSSAFGSIGNIYIPDQQGILWKDPATGGNIFNIRMWRGHDAVSGEAIIESSWRIAMLGQGPIQFGHNDALPTAQGLHLTSGASSAADTIKHSRPISWQTKRYNGGTEQDGYIIAQANSLSDNSASTVLRFSISESPASGPWDGFNGGGGTYTKGLSNGTDMAEFSSSGIWHSGTNPSFSSLTDAATITWTLSKYHAVQHGAVTLGGNRTLAFSGLLTGMRGTLVVTQDSTGSRSLALPTGSKTPSNGLGAVTLSTTANAVDVLDWFYDGNHIYWTSSLNYTGQLDVDAQSFLTAAGITDDTQETAVNNLVLGLKNASLWTRFTAIYPFVGGDSAKHSYNLKTPGSYQITWSGTVTHDANGITGNGSTGYGNTGLAASAVGSTTSQFIYVYNKTALPTTNGHFLSAYSATGGYRSALNHYKPGSTDYVSMGGLNGTSNNVKFTDASSNLKGHIGGNITDASNQVLWFNALSGSVAVSASGRSNQPFYLLAQNNNGSAASFSNANLAFAAIGETLTSGEWSTFKGLIDTFQTALSRAN